MLDPTVWHIPTQLSFQADQLQGICLLGSGHQSIRIQHQETKMPSGDGHQLGIMPKAPDAGYISQKQRDPQFCVDVQADDKISPKGHGMFITHIVEISGKNRRSTSAMSACFAGARKRDLLRVFILTRCTWGESALGDRVVSVSQWHLKRGPRLLSDFLCGVVEEAGMRLQLTAVKYNIIKMVTTYFS